MSHKPVGSYETGADGAAGRPPGSHRVLKRLLAARGAAVGALGCQCLSLVLKHRYQWSDLSDHDGACCAKSGF